MNTNQPKQIALALSNAWRPKHLPTNQNKAAFLCWIPDNQNIDPNPTDKKRTWTLGKRNHLPSPGYQIKVRIPENLEMAHFRHVSCGVDHTCGICRQPGEKQWKAWCWGSDRCDP